MPDRYQDEYRQRVEERRGREYMFIREREGVAPDHYHAPVEPDRDPYRIEARALMRESIAQHQQIASETNEPHRAYTERQRQAIQTVKLCEATGTTPDPEILRLAQTPSAQEQVDTPSSPGVTRAVSAPSRSLRQAAATTER